MRTVTQTDEIDINCGVVVRGDIEDIQSFKKLVETFGLQVIYTKVSGQKLWIKEGDDGRR